MFYQDTTKTIVQFLKNIIIYSRHALHQCNYLLKYQCNIYNWCPITPETRVFVNNIKIRFLNKYFCTTFRLKSKVYYSAYTRLYYN